MLVADSNQSLMRTTADTFGVILLLPAPPEIPAKHAVKGMIRLARIIIGKAIVGRQVKRESVDTLEALVKERLKYGLLVRPVLQSQQSGIPLRFELRQATVTI